MGSIINTELTTTSNNIINSIAVNITNLGDILDSDIFTTNNKLDTIDTDLNSKFNTTNSNLNQIEGDLTSFANNTSNSFTTVNTKLTTIDTDLNNKLNTVNTNLTTINTSITSLNTINSNIPDLTGAFTYTSARLFSGLTSITITGRCISLKVYASVVSVFKINNDGNITLDPNNGTNLFELLPYAQLINPIVTRVSGDMQVFLGVLN